MLIRFYIHYIYKCHTFEFGTILSFEIQIDLVIITTIFVLYGKFEYETHTWTIFYNFRSLEF